MKKEEEEEDFLNRMSCKNCNGVMLVNIFLKIFSQVFKFRVECSFKYYLFRAMIINQETIL